MQLSVGHREKGCPCNDSSPRNFKRISNDECEWNALVSSPLYITSLSNKYNNLGDEIPMEGISHMSHCNFSLTLERPDIDELQAQKLEHRRSVRSGIRVRVCCEEGLQKDEDLAYATVWCRKVER